MHISGNLFIIISTHLTGIMIVSLELSVFGKWGSAEGDYPHVARTKYIQHTRNDMKIYHQKVSKEVDRVKEDAVPYKKLEVPWTFVGNGHSEKKCSQLFFLFSLGKKFMSHFDSLLASLVECRSIHLKN